MGLVVLALWLLAPPVEASVAPVPLTFQEFFSPGPRALKPSARLLALEGKRVRMVGFMARMEDPPKGGFFLCSLPVFAAEGGGGTADLPPDAVFVVVSSAEGQELETIERPLEVTGVLELGSKADAEGRVTRIRIVLDGPRPLP